MREVIKQAATVDEAIELALKELNLSREDVTAEVLDYPEKKLFFKKPAKVKVSELEPDFDVKEMFKEKPEVKQTAIPQKPQPTAEKHTAPRSEVQQPQPSKPYAPKPSFQGQEKSDYETGIEVPESELSEKAKYSMTFLKSIIGQFFDGEYKMQPIKTQTGYIIKIIGTDAGCLIGRKGETMEALSYLTSLAANRNDDNEEKISVDVADYRQKRENDLKLIAQKMAEKVAKSGRAYTFEPMNPYERRIIHATVGEVAGVKSESKGEGSQRRVAIYSTAPRKPYTPRPQGDRPYTPRPQGDKPYAPRPQGDKAAYGTNRTGSSRPPYNRDRRDAPPPPPQKTREEKLVDGESAPLYTKVEL
ncbi:MAG: RNA-binding cell elongation regulator Jag/EloR [Oscillospiraceae bacterium]